MNPMTMGPGAGSDGPDGYSYGAVLVAHDEPDDVVATLRWARFTGWIAPPADGWIVAIGTPGAGVVASDRRGIVEVGAALARATNAVVIAVRVRDDRQLAIVAWEAGAEIGRYSSDPSREPGADREVVSDPYGAESADALARVCGRAEAAEGLAELLDDELDPDRVFEYERLATVLRMLGLPGWVVAVSALPRDIPTGPRAGELVRMRAGALGFGGIVRNAFVKRGRRRRHPPPVIADPPRENLAGIEPWML